MCKVKAGRVYVTIDFVSCPIEAQNQRPVSFRTIRRDVSDLMSRIFRLVRTHRVRRLVMKVFLSSMAPGEAPLYSKAIVTVRHI